jgi:hypothetical protein
VSLIRTPQSYPNNLKNSYSQFENIVAMQI